MPDLLEVGYALFNAQERTFNDGNENCKATLYATNLMMQQTAYPGATGQGTHAEMNAIVQFLQAINYNHNNLPNYVLEIECLSKPCCKNCSAVLGLLGVSTSTQRTYKVNKAMGSTQWCLPPTFRDLLVNMGHARRDVNALCGLC
ncbi:MAG: hypothetical protein ABSG03_21060 [Bryobacteraceae bacterium]